MKSLETQLEDILRKVRNRKKPFKLSITHWGLIRKLQNIAARPIKAKELYKHRKETRPISQLAPGMIVNFKDTPGHSMYLQYPDVSYRVIHVVFERCSAYDYRTSFLIVENLFTKKVQTLQLQSTHCRFKIDDAETKKELLDKESHKWLASTTFNNK